MGKGGGVAVMGLRRDDWRVLSRVVSESASFFFFFFCLPVSFLFSFFLPLFYFFWGEFFFFLFVCLLGRGFGYFGYFGSVHNIISYHIIASDSQTRLSAVLGTGHTAISAALHRTRLG